MKTVLLLRHGKSDWDAEYARDHERPLAKRGIRAARSMGRLVSMLDLIPHHVISSTAARACGTAELAGLAGGWPCAVELEPALYESGPEEALAVLRRAPDAIDRVMLVGHEPTWSLLAEGLIGGGNIRFPTAAVCRIDLDVERWRDAEFGTGTLRWLLPPRLLDRIGFD